MRKYLSMKGNWSHNFRSQDGETPPVGGNTRRIRILITGWFVFAVLFASVMMVFFPYQLKVSLNTKTVAGDNLDLPPLPAFPQPTVTIEEQQSRTEKIQGCANQSCRLSLGNLLERLKAPRFNFESPKSCPLYFQWIYADLAPWRKSGITRETLEKARSTAFVRIVIVGGRLYTDIYLNCYETRAMFTLWGFLMLLERYPGSIPDVELMFSCADRPIVRKEDYDDNTWPPPPLFVYCNTKDHYDIPFPDWSYWGWPEVNIRPWDQEMETIVNRSKRIAWSKRLPLAYWKGNVYMSQIRQDLQQCNNVKDCGVRIFNQNWEKERAAGFKSSSLADQCGYRYKIYAEGIGWSASLKYIVACGSTLLFIDTQFVDFFMRGLRPLVEYLPIQHTKLCTLIKFVVQWGNKNPKKAAEIGQNGQHFLQAEFRMRDVYDYMFHLLSEYSRLLRFKPSIPPSATELCWNSMLCDATPIQRDFLQQSYIDIKNNVAPPPCSIPHLDQEAITKLFDDQRNRSLEVQIWEHEIHA